MVDWKSGSKGKEHTVNTHTGNTDDETREATRRAADRFADHFYNELVRLGRPTEEAEKASKEARQAWLDDAADDLDNRGHSDGSWADDDTSDVDDDGSWS